MENEEGGRPLLIKKRSTLKKKLKKKKKMSSSPNKKQRNESFESECTKNQILLILEYGKSVFDGINDKIDIVVCLNLVCKFFHNKRISTFSNLLGLSLEQAQTLSRVLERKNVFITGPGGTGKSYMVRIIRNYFYHKNKEIIITGTTGLNSQLIGGNTIHSFTGIGIQTEINDYNIKRIITSARRKIFKLLTTLVIDEISMLNNKQLDLIDEVLKVARNKKTPFGGVQMIFCGDFLQLPPVSGRYAFHAKSWKDGGVLNCNLTIPFRQKTDDWFSILNQIRVGIQSPHIEKYIRSNSLQADTEKSIKIWSTNKRVDEHNLNMLRSIDGDEVVFKSETVTHKPGNYDRKIQNLRYVKTLKLKVGCRIIYLKNQFQLTSQIGEIANRIVNGSTGTIEEIDRERYILKIKFDHLEEPVEILRDTENIVDDRNKILVSRTQFALTLGYAITIHKCQGMTLESVSSSLSAGEIFASGQAYVLLSRLVDIRKSFIEKFDLASIRVDRECLKFYQQNQ